jgi:hypothetical protein
MIDCKDSSFMQGRRDQTVAEHFGYFVPFVSFCGNLGSGLRYLRCLL